MGVVIDDTEDLEGVERHGLEQSGGVLAGAVEGDAVDTVADTSADDVAHAAVEGGRGFLRDGWPAGLSAVGFGEVLEQVGAECVVADADSGPVGAYLAVMDEPWAHAEGEIESDVSGEIDVVWPVCGFGLAVGEGEGAYGGVEDFLEALAALRQFLADLVFGAAGEVGVVDGVGADGPACVVELAEVLFVHEWQCGGAGVAGLAGEGVAEGAGGDVDRGADAALLQDGPGVLVDGEVAVVEGQGDALGREAAVSDVVEGVVDRSEGEVGGEEAVEHFLQLPGGEEHISVVEGGAGRIGGIDGVEREDGQAGSAEVVAGCEGVLAADPACVGDVEFDGAEAAEECLVDGEAGVRVGVVFVFGGLMSFEDLPVNERVAGDAGEFVDDGR